MDALLLPFKEDLGTDAQTIKKKSTSIILPEYLAPKWSENLKHLERQKGILDCVSVATKIPPKMLLGGQGKEHKNGGGGNS